MIELDAETIAKIFHKRLRSHYKKNIVEDTQPWLEAAQEVLDYIRGECDEGKNDD